MHRSTLVILFAALLVSEDLGAQSLEESYAKLCPQPAVENVEACSALQQAMIAKQGQEQPQSRTSKSSEAPSVADPTWGPLAQLANTAWGVGIPGSSTMALVDRFTWTEDGTAVRFTSELPGMPASLTEIVFRPGPEPGILSAVIKYQSQESKVLFRFNEGVLVSDWYLTVSGEISNRQEIRLTGDGQYESRKAQHMSRKPSDPVGGPDFAPLHGQYKRYSESGIAQLEAQSRGVGAAIERQAAEQVAADQRAAQTAKAARSNERAAMFGAVLQGIAQGAAEVNTGGYAESQANLDAAVANIQYAADVERQQQNSSLQASQQPARASQPQPMQVSPSTSTSGASSLGTDPAPGVPVQREVGAATGEPLRFVMSISLRNQPGDKVNPTCYSNIISRPGPPGWGAPGFLPRGSAEQARETVYSLKSAFIAQCRASGREITSDGNFNFQLNQSQGDEERLQGMRARYSEDVSVSL